MTRLDITMIDVGWGDSILLEARTDADDPSTARFALIDSNDTSTLRSSYIFLKRYFETLNIDIPRQEPIFDWVLLSHIHADHGQGLKGILRHFGTKTLWYPKSDNSTPFFTTLMRYANYARGRVDFHQAVDNGKIIPKFGPVSIDVLWPPPDHHLSESKANNNSVILSLSLGDVSCVLSGDAEHEVWQIIAGSIPSNTQIFKIPHHGSENGTFTPTGQSPWLDKLCQGSKLGISSHVRPRNFHHPSPRVVTAILNAGHDCYRTDENYHITFRTDGITVDTKYSSF